jgi:glyceraldehyde 3-phosphate dehydrogenase
MALKVAINGFGRIGRLVVRAAKVRKLPIDFVAVNDLTDAATLAHLLKYDSVHRVWAEASGHAVDGKLVIGADKIEVLAEKDPAKLPWKSLGVDIVLEATGRFTEREKAAAHLTAGAKAVLVSAPAKGADLTFVFGVNDKLFDRAKHTVFSIGSCTTNCLAPVAKVLDDSFGIDHGLMTTIHAYTNDQNILDLPHKDLRRARAAAVSLIPTSTGAAKAIGEVLPGLKGKLDGILEYCTDPIVSNDVIGNPASSVFDSLSTNVMQGDMVKVLSWYDNEWGFSNRVVDALMKLH